MAPRGGEKRDEHLRDGREEAADDDEQRRELLRRPPKEVAREQLDAVVHDRVGHVHEEEGEGQLPQRGPAKELERLPRRRHTAHGGGRRAPLLGQRLGDERGGDQRDELRGGGNVDGVAVGECDRGMRDRLL